MYKRYPEKKDRRPGPGSKSTGELSPLPTSLHILQVFCSVFLLDVLAGEKEHIVQALAIDKECTLEFLAIEKEHIVGSKQIP